MITRQKYDRSQLILDYLEKGEQEMLFFWGHTESPDHKLSKFCLSQWWESHFEVDGVGYYSMEQYMMAEKARLFEDHSVLLKIMNEKNPKAIKALGREVRYFDELVWDENKYEIVVRGNYAKFSQNRYLKEYLLGTEGRILVEASPYDCVWGIGKRVGDVGIEDPRTWKGKNMLGFALMEVRDWIKED